MRQSSSVKSFAPALAAADAKTLATTRDPAELVKRVGYHRRRGIPTRSLAIALKMSESDVRHLLRLESRLTPRSLACLSDGTMTLRQARIVAALDGRDQELIARLCRKQPIRAVEEMVKLIRQGELTVAESADPTPELPGETPTQWRDHYANIETQVGEQAGYPCQIRTDAGNERAGHLLLRFTSLDELEGILARLRVRTGGY